MSNRKHHRVLSSIVLLAATSTLFACSESDVSEVSATQPEPATTALAIEKTRALTNPTSPVSQSLKEVSATVYKDPNCGCCKEWIDHAQSHGMSATTEHPEDLSLFKERYGVPDTMRSCHTTVTADGYVFEGHVPAKYLAQFLASPPSDAIGLAVPGMPVGSPGMEYQDKFMPYQVMQLNKDGSNSVYADIKSPQQQL